MMHNGRILDEAGVYGGQAIPQVPAATASSYSSGSVVTHESSRPKFSYGVQLDAVDPSASLDLQHHAPASSSISASRHGHTTNTNTPTSATTASPVINSSNSNVSGNDIESQQSDWLAEAQRTLSQDLETSKKELEIIRYIIEEMRTREQNRNQNQNQNRIQGQQEKQSEATLENSRNDNTVQREEDMRTGREDSRMRLMSACREYTRSRCHLLRDRLRQVQFWTHARRLGNYVPGKAPEDWRVVDVEWRAWLSEQAKAYNSHPGGDQVSPLDYSSDPMNDVAWRVWGTLSYILSSDIWGSES